MLNPESVMPNQVLNLIQDLTISASLQGRLVYASHEPDPEPTRETSSGHGSDLMIEKTYDLCHGELFTWCYESSEILPFRPAPLHLRAPG